MVGYGPDPRECLNLVMARCGVALMGNHDLAALGDAACRGFNANARRAILWTREQLLAPAPDLEAAGRRLAFLAGLPAGHREGGVLYVHASPRDPLNEYVRPDDADDWEKMGGLFTEHRDGDPYEHHSPAELGGAYRPGRQRFLCNVGSVEQPRDGDPRACYVLFDGRTVRWRRVGYDVDAAAARVRAVRDLAGPLAERLLEGR